MSDRSDMIEWLRGEIVGPSRRISEPTVATFVNGKFTDTTATRRGPLVWRPDPEADLEEVLYFNRESPHRKYGTGCLHLGAAVMADIANGASPDVIALQAMDTIGAEFEEEEAEFNQENGADDSIAEAESSDASDDFEVTSPDVRHPSTIGISFCVQLGAEGSVVIRLPQARRFAWQEEDSPPFALNGRYESCKRCWTDLRGQPQESPMWRRYPAVPPDCQIVIARDELINGRVIRRDVTMSEDSPLQLRVEIFPRYRQNEDVWLLTVVLRNTTPAKAEQGAHQCVLYQSYFEVFPKEGHIRKYPESQRPFDQLDEDEQSLALLYRESATWGIGHGCACGWEAEPGQTPPLLFADILPAVELPSMTPDIFDAQETRFNYQCENSPHCQTTAMARLGNPLIALPRNMIPGFNEAGSRLLKHLIPSLARWLYVTLTRVRRASKGSTPASLSFDKTKECAKPFVWQILPCCFNRSRPSRSKDAHSTGIEAATWFVRKGHTSRHGTSMPPGQRGVTWEPGGLFR